MISSEDGVGVLLFQTVNLTLFGGGILVARVAQSVERSAVNRKVGGSNPPVSDIFYIII